MNSVKIDDIFTYQNETYVVHSVVSDSLFHMHSVGDRMNVVSVAVTPHGMAAVACTMPGWTLRLLPQLVFNNIERAQND